MDHPKDDVSAPVAAVCLLDLETAPVNSEEVKLATRRDPLLGKVLKIVLRGSGNVR